MVDDDGVELEPHAATDATTTAATVMNRTDINLCVFVFKILLPRSGWRLRANERTDGVADGMQLPNSGRRSAGCGTSRVQQYQLRIVDPAPHIPPCNQANQPRSEMKGRTTCQLPR